MAGGDDETAVSRVRVVIQVFVEGGTKSDSAGRSPRPTEDLKMLRTESSFAGADSSRILMAPS